jgi:hypothetical protein
MGRYTEAEMSKLTCWFLTGHSYTEWYFTEFYNIVADPNERTRKCTNCGYTQTYHPTKQPEPLNIWTGFKK